jgi:hypothetical protein
MHIHTADELKAMTETEHKVLENKLRRMLRRRGHSLVKSRIRDPRGIGYGKYMIAETTFSCTPRGNLTAGRIVAGDAGFGWTMGLDDVERWLDAPE